MPDLHVAVIIPSSLNTPQMKLLDQSITSLFLAQKKARKLTLTVVVVSSRRVSQQTKKKYPQVQFVKTITESGFAELNNVALQYLQRRFAKLRQPDFLLLLNDDAWIESDFFTALEKQPQADIYTPILFEAKRRTEIDSYGVEYFRSGYAKNSRSIDTPTTLATAGCEVIRWKFVQKFMKRYGFFFNTLYFYYLEDVDLSIRAVMIGGTIRKSSQLVAYHHGSATSGGKRNTFALRYTYRNVLWVVLCCWPLKDILRNLPNILLVQGWILLYSTAVCGVLTYPNLIGQTLLSLPELVAQRRRIQRAYTHTSFAKLLSPLNFRTYHNQTIPAV